MGALRRSMLASLSLERAPAGSGEQAATPISRSLHAERGLAEALGAAARGSPPAETAHEALLRSLSALSPFASAAARGESFPSPPSAQALASSPPLSSSPPGAMRLVTASGQPRKLPAAAAASGRYANAFFARTPPPGDPAGGA